MDSQNKGNKLVRSVLTGLGMATLFLLIGTILDYLVMQTLSQFVLENCSEDCYFQYFNAIFYVVTILSIVGGLFIGIRTYRRWSMKG